jgi:carboxyl-terminal processing protease
MSKKFQGVVLVLSSAILLFVVAGVFNVDASNKDDAYPQMEVYSEVLSRIESEYVEQPNITDVTDGALHGLLESLDADSSYLTPAQYQEYKDRNDDGHANVGAVISKRFGYASIIAVIPGSPAEKAGLQDSDIIETIEGKSTRDMSVAEIHARLSGQPGSTIEVEVVRAQRAEPQKITLTRELIALPAASDKLMDGGIGYIQVKVFNKGKTQEITNKIKNLQKEGAKKLILDLRDCAEGEESEGISTANLFLNHGTITYLQGQKYPRQAFNAEPAKDITDLPLAVLVNKGTAGPAELVAAAILDNARGDVIGDKTFGEGAVTKLIELPDGGALILSVAKYYAPDGKAIEDAAVTPNVIVADNSDNSVVTDDDESESSTPPAPQAPQPDLTLQKAVQVLQGRTT